MSFGGRNSRSNGGSSNRSQSSKTGRGDSSRSNSRDNSRGGFKGGSRGKTQSNSKKKSNIFNIGSIWEGEYGEYISFNDYYGDLYYKHKETGEYFKVKSAVIGKPYNKQRGLNADLSINLDNDKQAIFIGDEDGDNEE